MFIVYIYILFLTKANYFSGSTASHPKFYPTSLPYIAPFWNDADISCNDGKIFWRDVDIVIETEVVAMAVRDSAAIGVTMVPTLVFIATWDDNPAYPGKQSEVRSIQSIYSYIQLLLRIDWSECQTYTIYNLLEIVVSINKKEGVVCNAAKC